MTEEIAYIRPARLEDLDHFYRFAKEAGFGFTHLPRDKKVLEYILRASIESFAKKLDKPRHESYYFVLQMGDKVIGSCGIISRIGISEPFYAYHLLTTEQSCSLLGIKREVPVLHFIQARKKPTELCALFLQEAFRKKEYGRLLSFSRFLFIASFRLRFAPVIISELRGVCDEKGHSPFWDAIGKPFFGMDFDAANSLRISHPECIEELFPTHPIYPMLLSKEAQSVIGIPYPLTMSALKLLQKQGFMLSHYVDLFDAGPHVYAHTDAVKAIVDSKVGIIKEIKSFNAQSLGLISNEKLDFRACIASFEVDPEGNVILDAQAAKAIKVDLGNQIRYLKGHL